MAIGQYRFNPRSNKSVREQWGPTLEEERGEALRRMMDRGQTPSSFGSMDKFEAARQQEVQAERDRRGPQAYDQSQGKMVSSPKARRERLSAEMDAAEKGKAEAKKKGDKDFERARKTPGARSYFNADEEWAGWQPSKDGSKSRFIRQTDGDELVQIQTPSGGFVSAKGKNVASNYDASRYDEEERLARLAQVRANGRAIRDRLDTEMGDKLAAQLKSEGVVVTPRREDGSIDLDKAQGMLASAKQNEWAEEKRMLAVGREQQKMDRQRLRDLTRELRNDGFRGRYMTAQERRERENERAGLIASTQYMNDRDLRDYGVRAESNRLAEIERSRQVAEAQNKQADAVMTKIESTGQPPTDAQLKMLGYPDSSDAEAWQELIKTDPVAAKIYQTFRSPKVSSSGRAMSRALSAFV